jgi:hypothetical protein
MERVSVRGLAFELLLVAAAAVVYAGVRVLTEGQMERAVANAGRILDVEAALGLAWERSIQGALLGSETLVTVANWVYIWGHWPVIAVAAGCLYAMRRDRYYLLRNAMFVSGAIGFGFFALLPVAPPPLLPGYVDTILDRSTSYRTLQPPSLTNAIAAMPSLHFGWNLLVGIVLFTVSRRLLVRAFAFAMPAAMGFAVVVTANHFVLDVIVGGAVVLAAYVAARRVTRRSATTLAPLDGPPRSRHDASRDRAPRGQRPASFAQR